MLRSIHFTRRCGTETYSSSTLSPLTVDQSVDTITEDDIHLMYRCLHKLERNRKIDSRACQFFRNTITDAARKRGHHAEQINEDYLMWRAHDELLAEEMADQERALDEFAVEEWARRGDLLWEAHEELLAREMESQDDMLREAYEMKALILLDEIMGQIHAEEIAEQDEAMEEAERACFEQQERAVDDVIEQEENVYYGMLGRSMTS